MEQDRLKYLLAQLADRSLTQAEKDELQSFFEVSGNTSLFSAVAGKMEIPAASVKPYDDSLDDILQQVISFDRIDADNLDSIRVTAIKPVHRIHFLKTAWFYYAASILIIFAVCAYLYNTQKTKMIPGKMVKAEDIPSPKTNRATLTLTTGKKIYLDSAADGILALEGEIKIEKTEEGNIIYAGKNTNNITQYNVLTVPRGSQVAGIVLSDGSKVFLNAASTLKYPITFNGTERKVEITGEGYFEIAKDAKKKFIVISEGVQTEVLGTHFNVNAYPDEASSKITLIEGSVKVSSNSANIIIKPAQQAEIAKDSRLKTNENINISQVMGWKKGVFVFSNMDLQSVLRQIGRWYNVDIAFKSQVHSDNFGGTLSRSSPLSDVVNILESNGVPCSIEGSKLIIGK